MNKAINMINTETMHRALFTYFSALVIFCLGFVYIAVFKSAYPNTVDFVLCNVALSFIYYFVFFGVLFPIILAIFKSLALACESKCLVWLCVKIEVLANR